MALLDAEIARIKAELGYSLLTIGAIPYIGITQVFEQVIQANVLAGAATTSSTSVSAQSSPTPVTITLASATGFAVGCRVVVDVDDRQETATAQSLSSTSLTLQLSKTHSGTYPVTVEGGESIVREILNRIRAVKSNMATSFGAGALRKVDEIEFYNSGGASQFGSLGDELSYWRDELAAALGIESMWARRRAGAQRLAVY